MKGLNFLGAMLLIIFGSIFIVSLPIVWWGKIAGIAFVVVMSAGFKE